MIVLGIIVLIYGLFAVINGKMPFITKYSGIKNISLHCRIEGSTIILASLSIILFNYLNLDSVCMMILLITLCIITIIIEIILKVF